MMFFMLTLISSKTIREEFINGWDLPSVPQELHVVKKREGFFLHCNANFIVMKSAHTYLPFHWHLWMHPSEGLREQTLTDLHHPEVKQVRRDLELENWSKYQVRRSRLDRNETTCQVTKFSSRLKNIIWNRMSLSVIYPASVRFFLLYLGFP